MIDAGSWFLADAHVHLHACFDTPRFFSAAASNISLWADRLGKGGRATGVLLLTESADTDRFGELAAGGVHLPFGWYQEEESDPDSLVLRFGELRLIVIAGRQIATEEGLEVLSLAGRARFPDGLPFRETLQAVQDADAIAVIPWGFGKWWLRRGRVVEEAVRTAAPGRLYLGDNGGRPDQGPPPALFRLAERRGIGILPGSDPLPFPEHEGRAGSYGFILRGLSLERTAASLRESLSRGLRPEPYGRRASLRAFSRDQLRMQLWKRARRTRRLAARPMGSHCS